MTTNIPIYRAKKIDRVFHMGRASKATSNKFIEGDLLPIDNILHIVQSASYIDELDDEACGGYYDLRAFEIDPSTLSISFPDMLDRNNKCIFASLSEDGKGGDNVQYFIGDKKCISVARYVDRGFDYTDGELKVTGIYKGDSNE